MLERWYVPRDWDGATVAIVGCGPSLSDTQCDRLLAAHAIGTIRVIAVNRAWERTPFADLLWGCDARWWDWESGKRALQQFAGVAATQDSRAAVSYPRLKWLEASEDPDAPEGSAERHGGYDARPGYVRTGRNGGYQAAHLAIQRGAARLLLVGFDHRAADDGRTHWHERHPRPTSADVYANLMLPCWRTLVRPAADLGVRVVNVTPGSAIDCFSPSTLAAEL